MVNKAILWVFIANYRTWGGGCENPWLCSQVGQKGGTLGIQYLRLASKVGAVLWDWAFNRVGSALTLGSWVLELDELHNTQLVSKK